MRRGQRKGLVHKKKKKCLDFSLYIFFFWLFVFLIFFFFTFFFKFFKNVSRFEITLESKKKPKL